jgi:UDP-glucose 4-epimerase
MIIGDVLDRELVLKSCESACAVYNFSGVADIDEARKKPFESAQINILGNLNILEGAKRAQAERLVFASTAYVFSDSGSFYRVSKQACEKYIEAFYEEYGLKYTILRYGSLYGRRAPESNGIRKMLGQALTENQITYIGSEEAMREYVHVEDAARLSVQILGAEYANRHFMITGQERLSVKALTKMISEMLPNKPKVNYQNKTNDIHYVMSPYSFNPKIGHKLTSNEHVDLGQGLLDCLADIKHQEVIERESIV